MLEFRPTDIGIVRIAATPQAIDELEAPTILRLSEAEALVLTVPEEEPLLLERVREQLAEFDPGSLVVTDSDAFAAWTLTGRFGHSAFARLSALQLPRTRPTFVQGLVADVPTKVLATRDRLLLIVGSPVSHHLRSCVLERCAGLDVVELDRDRFPAATEPVG